MSEYLWKVVPLSKGQLLDVRPKDILNDGAFRKCDTYRGGGGYDLFPILADKFFGEPNHNLQFVVQLFGCNLDCPYCYVTRAGVWGKTIKFSSEELVRHFNESPCTVFHLMGGAPALKLSHWEGLLETLTLESKKSRWLFHSDLMLTERHYSKELLYSINHARALYAVNIKGVTSETFETNTRKKMDEKLFWKNLELVQASYINHYFTFTNLPDEEIKLFWSIFKSKFGWKLMERKRETASSIDLKDYIAETHVDEIPWGRNELLPSSQIEKEDSTNAKQHKGDCVSF